MKTVAAVARTEKAPFSLEEVTLPEPEGADVLVRIAGVGICHTDLASRDGTLGAPFPSIFGHEGAGVVEKVGPLVTKLRPGDHVVLAPASDGTCRHCQTGNPMYCEHFTELNFQTEPRAEGASLSDGKTAALRYFGQSSFGHHALASERNAVKVPTDIPLHLLGPLGCGIQTGAGTVMNGLRPEAGQSIVILGTGAVGLAAIIGAAVCGCGDIIAVDRVDSRLEMARELGATHTINTSNVTDLGTAIMEIVPHGVDFIVDCAGVAGLLGAAILGLGKLGTVALVAVPPTSDRKLEVAWFPTLLQGQSVRGFVEGNSVPDIFIPRMIELYVQGRFPFDKIIKTYPFDQINRAVEDQLTGATIKAVLKAGD
ncbi:NAD(P)-dependent alcohol dehydrogenase [Sinorhizobium mexicanum]|uniref:NAD(P)-dependent alcohol dehydrogenase n=1 Tax=Sinorhizobium mexicanum TaxID=375549 RepID=A0A859QQ65_9HYPH|nr:NAD(P)-dependent alcohol dehydrogenase [Sinorhizobium mexicanum]MBP1881851.1 aryl-alcohol dehydrogenase [Sinorhizobium mexicanum]QLL61599.1 NAD(P)-dependent alcohol dehydrogenase [Sinorhizobium mexicanum]